ncbi:DUF6795 domain-containing protein [Shewanella sp. ENK2]|uniref:DUF6795 domain-containing protein n=1 Tax=Shewanella sp. ENK2 TaxID=2775245 RepID=UPI001786BAF3|nr:DUF6795 domain-containing protein [Shewanella sp. WPAGA9]
MKKFTVFAALVSCLLMLVVSSHSEGTVLGIFKKAVDVEVFPAVSGKITLNGKPVEGLKLLRSYIYYDVTSKDGTEDYSVTDSDGNFTFPEILVSSKHPNGAFSVNMIAQIIMIDDDRFESYKEKYLWDTKARGITQSKFHIERLRTLNCELSEEEVSHQIIDDSFPDGTVRYEIFSICRWPELEQIEVEKREKFGEF